MEAALINKYPFADTFTGIEVPASLKAEMEKVGAKQHAVPVMRPIDTGIQIKRPEPMRERELSTQEFLNLFDREESLRMVYVPHFLTQCIIYYLDRLTEYAISNRLSDYKKHSRMLKRIKADYIEALRHEMPYDFFHKFLAQRDEYLRDCGANLNLMFFTFNNQMLKKYGSIDHEPFYSYANIILFLVKYVDDFDNEVNKHIAEKLGKPCRNQGDARLTAIKYVCNDIVKPYPLEKNKDTDICVGVMANKALQMIKNML